MEHTQGVAITAYTSKHTRGVIPMLHMSTPATLPTPLVLHPRCHPDAAYEHTGYVADIAGAAPDQLITLQVLKHTIREARQAPTGSFKTSPHQNQGWEFALSLLALLLKIAQILSDWERFALNKRYTVSDLLRSLMTKEQP